MFSIGLKPMDMTIYHSRPMLVICYFVLDKILISPSILVSRKDKRKCCAYLVQVSIAFTQFADSITWQYGVIYERSVKPKGSTTDADIILAHVVNTCRDMVMPLVRNPSDIQSPRRLKASTLSLNVETKRNIRFGKGLQILTGRRTDDVIL